MSSRLVVVTTAELGVGYRLAGAATVEVASALEAESQLSQLLDRERGVIAVHAPYFDQLSRALRRRLDATVHPLVVALPAGTSTAHDERRRDQLAQMLRQAVGYEITFDDERTTP
jgi:V/A-type H+-transporting ATPase subunit F